ncbi:MAG: tagaturonate epimerase family protein [Nitrososphaerota archaeon]
MMEVKESIGPRYLGVVHHPAIGIRIPEVFLTGILKAFKKKNVAGGLMLSFGRETATEEVINAPPGKYEITKGHTGTSIKKYITMSAEAALREGLIIEIEADHIMIIGSSIKAVKRIAGIHEETKIDMEELKKSIEYAKNEIDEAISTNFVNSFTIDTCDLFNLDVHKWDNEKLKNEFEKVFPENERKRLLNQYIGKNFKFNTAIGKEIVYKFNENEIMQFALKFNDSLKISKEIYDYIKGKMNKPFGFEIAFDETIEETKDKEMLFYLNEWKNLGAHVDYIAPNIGFKKRMDFRGDLKELKEKVSRLAAIAKNFGALLSIHSGSGTSPYSGKGPGTYKALLEATGGELKYKISGVYYELLMEILSSFPPKSEERKLYNKIFDEVYNYLNKQIIENGPLASPLLKKQIEKYKEEVKKGIRKKRDPRATFFRFYSYLALNFKDKNGKRYFRDKIVSLYNKNKKLHEIVDKEVEKLTLRLINGLNFTNNISKISFQ